jgi:hypothetical protein
MRRQESSRRHWFREHVPPRSRGWRRAMRHLPGAPGNEATPGWRPFRSPRYRHHRDQGPGAKTVKSHVCWQGGATETLELQLPPNRAEAVRYSEAFVTRIRELAIGHHDDDIIRLLHAEA